MIPAIGKPFKVTFKNHPSYQADGVIIGKTKSGDYKVSLINRKQADAVGKSYDMPDTVMKVEAQWFDPSTGRIIKPV